MRASGCGGVPRCGVPALDVPASVVAATGSVVVAPMPLRTGSALAHGLVALGMWVLPGPEIEPMSAVLTDKSFYH